MSYDLSTEMVQEWLSKLSSQDAGEQMEAAQDIAEFGAEVASDRRGAYQRGEMWLPPEVDSVQELLDSVARRAGQCHEKVMGEVAVGLCEFADGPVTEWIEKLLPERWLELEAATREVLVYALRRCSQLGNVRAKQLLLEVVDRDTAAEVQRQLVLAAQGQPREISALGGELTLLERLERRASTDTIRELVDEVRRSG